VAGWCQEGTSPCAEGQTCNEAEGRCETVNAGALFDTNCAICHPNNGIDPSGTPAAEVITKLEDVHYDPELTAEEIDAIADYVASQ